MSSLANHYIRNLAEETAFPTWLGGKPQPADSPKLDESKHAEHISVHADSSSEDDYTPKRRGLGKYWAVVATGAGLFSDGYINNSVGFVTTLLKSIYGKAELSKSSAMGNISAIAFVGTVVGMLVFGFLADMHSRKLGMLISTGILILFSILVAGAWGIGMPTNPQGMFAAITVYRAILGVGIGGEYPAGSVACAECSQMITSGRRNRWFVWFTNFMIDFGYVVAAFVAWLLLYICSVPHDGGVHGMQTAWRVLFGLGAVAPMSLLYLRTKFEDNDQFKQNNLKRASPPWWLIIKFYGPRLAVVSLIWFLYDFCAYSWGIYSSQIIQMVIPDGEIHTTFGWTVLFNVFYLPGAFLGAIAADYIGPRLTLLFGTGIQGIVGFIMASQYDTLSQHTAPFVVAYGIFIALGEFGPGDNIGLIASKTAPSAIRGRYYGMAAAVGKIGAFVGGYAFPAIAGHYGGLDSFKGQTTLLYISSALCVFSAILVLFVPSLRQSVVDDEDRKFREYLGANGFDVSTLGDAK